jgi:ornithine cyclodeaminase/alanine dehydrogenase-like protein (mu-crystallin family)
MAGDQLLMLNAPALQALITPELAIAAAREAFELHSSEGGDTYPVIREPLGQGPAPAVFGIKSGAIESQRLVGLKAAGFWSHNRSLGKPAHQATIVLIDSHTGRAQALLDGNAITTARTGAAGYWGIQLLAPQSARRICVVGTGVQAQVQLEYALLARPLATQVSYISRDAQPHLAFEQHFARRCDVRHSRRVEHAVHEADIIITATPSRAVLFEISALRDGQHINAVGADTRGKRELPSGTLELASHVWADDLSQARELGESQWCPGLEIQELGALLLGHSSYQRTASDRTVFDMTGLALQDLCLARQLVQAAQSQGLGQRIDWPW